MKGVSVNLEDESCQRHTRRKVARKEAPMENNVNGKALREEDAEFQSPKRKVLRVESEETQDYVRESLNLRLKQAEAISFGPSALSSPREPMFWCDNRCSDKALRFWQFASASCR